MSRVLIIAEAGVNHNGDLKLAKELVEAAAVSGADLVKFQTFIASKVVAKNAQKAEYQQISTTSSESQYEMIRKLELSRDKHEELISHCNKCGIGFFSTGFDQQSVDLLKELGLQHFKIPSGEITNLPYLRHIARFGKPIIISTGMAKLGEIEDSLEVLESSGTSREKVTVLHCNTEYPTPMSDVNLKAMLSIRDALGVRVGYSDHTLGIEVPIAATALGATVIEKHFTLDRNLPGPDHKASLEPEELKAMVSAIRNIEKALGDGVKRLQPSEARNLAVARKSIHLSRDCSAGESLSADMFVMLRPGDGISPMNMESLEGKRLKCELPKHHKLQLQDLE